MLKEQIENAAKLAIRRSPLAPTLRKLFRKKPLAKAHEIGAAAGWDSAARWLLSEDGMPVLADSRFHASFRQSINTDIDAEFLLTALRRRLLLSAPEVLEKPAVRETLCTLASQCLNNEYVWFVSEEETKILSERRAAIDGADAVRKLSWTMPAQLAMYYRPDRFLPAAGARGATLDRFENLPAGVRHFLEAYLSDREEEAALKKSIESFGAIDRSVSRIIADNYEQYPYPRWLDLETPEPGKRRERLREFFEENELAFLQRPFHVLVAGCGTGNKAIEYALGYGDNARVLAIDLSRASLAYAMRMARKYQVKNLEFLQGDLLDLPLPERRFDIVECTGVLHHLEDPVKGGEALVNSVRDGGIVHISLYSELARREIVRLRREYESRIPRMTSDDVRAYRRRWMQECPEVIDEKLPLRWDFFDLNRCKDLLFHPLEHRYTIPRIGQLLDQLGLEFRGLETPDLILTQYWTPYPSPKDRHSLSRWHQFELNNPDAFANLYEIWTRKTGH